MVLRFFVFLLCCLNFTLPGGFAQEFVVFPLSEKVNTARAETSPVIARDGSRLYFTRAGDPDFNRTLVEDSLHLNEELEEREFLNYLARVYSQLAGRPVRNAITSDFNQDVYLAGLTDSGRVTKVVHPPFPLNNALPNSVASLTPFEGELVLVNEFPPDGGMRQGYSVSRRQGDTAWSYPQPLQIDNYRNLGTDVTLTMSSDGSVLLYSMKAPDSQGGTDLYVSFKQEDGRWTAPLNLGYQVNTPYDEMTPYLSDDNKSLYFSSDRALSGGGQDIFVAFRLDETWRSWTPARRMKEPINSAFDDSQPCFNAHTGNLFFASNRSGNMDIYRSQIAPPNPIVVKVRGRVYHARTLKPLGATISTGPLSGAGAGAETSFYSEDGAFEVYIRKGEEALLKARRTGYQPDSETFFFKKSYFYGKVYEVQLFLEPLEEGMSISLSDTIYFQQSEAVILEKSYPALDELAQFLEENPGVSIRIEGHTDNVGESASLLRLSEKRAEAIKAYLLAESGLAPERISCRGYGAQRPLNDNSTEALRAQNRRVEVIVTGTGSETKKKK